MSRAARLHIHSSSDDAVWHFSEWLDGSTPKVGVQSCPNGWTTLDLVNFSLDAVRTEDWLRLGQRADVFFESFSTATLFGELVFVAAGEVRRHLVLDSDEVAPLETNIGKLRYETQNPLTDWSDVWTFVEEECWEREVE